MSYSPNKLIAFGRVTGATGVSTGRGAAVARTGAGVYTVTLPPDEQCDATEKVTSVTCINAAGAIANVTAETDQVTTIGTFSLPAGLAAGPVAADIDFNFAIYKVDPV